LGGCGSWEWVLRRRRRRRRRRLRRWIAKRVLWWGGCRGLEPLLVVWGG
jgi:hypothetical protein